MDIQFVAQIDASADVVAFPVRKGGASGLDALLGAAAAQARFDGAAGSVAETAAIDGGTAKRLLLVGIGEGSVHDLERGGAALTAKLQTSGVQRVVLHTPASQVVIAPFQCAALRNINLTLVGRDY